MRPNLLILFLFTGLLLPSLAKAQRDLIVTQAGEEIRCRILDETPTRFKYAYLGPKNKVLRNEIFKNLVSSFKYAYYDSDVIKNSKEIVRVPVSPKPKEEKEEETPKKEKAKTENEKPKVASKPAIEVKKEEKVASNSDLNKTKNSVSPTPNSTDLNKPSYPVRNQNTEPLANQKVNEPSISKTETSVITTKETSAQNEKANSVLEKSTVSEPKKEVVLKDSKDKIEKIKKDEYIPKKTDVKTPDTKLPEVAQIKPILKSETNIPSPTIKDLKSEPAKEIKSPDVIVKTETKIPSPTIKDSKTEPLKEIKSPEVIVKKEVEKVTVPDVKENTPVKSAEKTVKKDPIITKENKDILSPPAKPTEYKSFLKYRIGVKGGLGNVLANNTDTSPFGLYQEKLKRGWVLGADAAYFFKEVFGMGVKYTSLQSYNSTNKLDFNNPVSLEAIKNGSLSNTVSQKFIGPAFLIRKSIDFKTHVVLSLAPGMNFYSDKGVVNAANFKMKGQSFGGNANLGIDFLLGNDIFGRDIILSLEAGYNYGSINKVTLNGESGTRTLPTPINMNRLDFGIGMRFMRFPMYLR